MTGLNHNEMCPKMLPHATHARFYSNQLDTLGHKT
jgi:hypothetical protein